MGEKFQRQLNLELSARRGLASLPWRGWEVAREMAGADWNKQDESAALCEELLRLAGARLRDRAQARRAVALAVETLRRRRLSGETIRNPKDSLFQTVHALTANSAAEIQPNPAMPLLRSGPSAQPAPLHAEPDYRRRLRGYSESIGKLTSRNRKILLLRRLHGLNTAQVTERMGLPAAVVEERLVAALRRCWRAVRIPAHAKLGNVDPVLEAISWHARMQGGGLERARLQELERWLRARRRNARAYRIAESLWRDSALLQAVFNAEGRSVSQSRGVPERVFPLLFRGKPL